MPGRLCPNRSRRVRVGPGGGAPGCRGNVQVILLVAVSTPLKSWAKGPQRQDFDISLTARTKRSGVRLSPADLAAAFALGQWDIRCDTCDWSYKKVINRARALTRRKKGR